MKVEIPFVDKSIDKNDKKPVTNLSTNMGRQKRQKRQKNRVKFIAKFLILCHRAPVACSVDHMDHKPKSKYCWLSVQTSDITVETFVSFNGIHNSPIYDECQTQ